MNRMKFPRLPFILVLFVLTIIIAYYTVKPALLEYASAALYQRTYQTANDVLSAALSDCGDLVSIERNESGEIVALKTHAREMNQIKTKTVSSLIAELRQETNREIELPLGSITGSLFLSDRGPKLHLSVLPVSRVEAVYRNEFLDAGINQTLHKLVMRLKIHTGILFATKVIGETVEIDLCLSETVLVGKTPQFFAGIE